MKFKKYLLWERRTKAERLILYHGTSSTFLRKILSQGLKATPKQKVWLEDPGASFIQAPRTSLKGAYLTRNIMTAKSSATTAKQKFGGNSLIVIVLFQPRSGLPDEDNIRYTIERCAAKAMGSGRLSGWLYAINLAYYIIQGSNKEVTDGFIDCLKELMKGSFGVEIDERALNKKTAEEFMKAELMRGVAEVYANKKKEGEYQRFRIHSSFSDVLSRLGKKMKWEEIEEFVGNNILSRSEAQKNYLKALDAMTRMFKQERLSFKTKDTFYNVRSLEDINYRGRNRIIGIVEIMDKEDYYYDLKVRYGKIPDDFIKQWKERVGDKFKVIK